MYLHISYRTINRSSTTIVRLLQIQAKDPHQRLRRLDGSYFGVLFFRHRSHSIKALNNIAIDRLPQLQRLERKELETQGKSRELTMYVPQEPNDDQ